MKVIKGCWRDRREEVMAAQYEPFVFIASNGSKWMGEEEDDVPALLEVLGRAELDVDRFKSFITINPCRGVKNPRYYPGAGQLQWIDGPRLFAVEPVVRFFGNFVNLSHVFQIYTNDTDTIDLLTKAIEANLARITA